MADLRTCPGCGMRHARGEDVEPCASCMLDGWAVGLGLSIRRFVRRATVRGLAEQIDYLCGEIAYAKKHRMEATRYAAEHDFRTALSRLAALAMEVEP